MAETTDFGSSGLPIDDQILPKELPNGGIETEDLLATKEIESRTYSENVTQSIELESRDLVPDSLESRNQKDVSESTSKEDSTPSTPHSSPTPSDPLQSPSSGLCPLPVVNRNRKASTVTNNVRKESAGDAAVDMTFKLMLVGDSCTGKTCTLLRFKENAFLASNFISTVGIDYRSKIVNVSGKQIKLQIWDTAGQERFRSVTHSYYRDAQGIFLFFDVTNESSFYNVRNWLGEVKEHAPAEVALMLIGNKVDAFEKRVIHSADAEKLAEEFDVSYIETSAKTGHNVELAFTSLAKELTMRRIDPKLCEGRFSIIDLTRPVNAGQSCYHCGS